MINYPRPGPQPRRALPLQLRAAWHPAPTQPRDPPRISAVDTSPLESTEPLLAAGWTRNGRQVAAFEREFAAHVGAEHAVAVASGAGGVELALRALRLPHGSRVLVSTLATCSVLQSILRAGLRPVLLDVSTQTGRPSAEHLPVGGEESRPVRALVVTHWAGDPAEVAALAAAAGVTADAVVEDTGQSLGSRLVGQPVGGAGSACFGFYTTANLALGEGGMVVTDDPGRAVLLRHTRDHGTSPLTRRQVLGGQVAPHVLPEGGLQPGMAEQTAARGRAELRRLSARQLRRRELAQRYDERLGEIPGLALPHRPAKTSGLHAWQLYPVRIERPGSDRDAVVRALALAGVGTVEPLVPLHQLSFCRDVCEVPPQGLCGADGFVDRLVSLPIHPHLPGTVVDRVGDVLEAQLGRQGLRSRHDWV